MIEALAVDRAARAERLAVLDLVVGRDDRDGNGAGCARDLDRLAAEAASATPDEYDVACGNRVRRPTVQHPIRGRADQHVGRGRFPGEVLRLRQALVRLDPGEL